MSTQSLYVDLSRHDLSKKKKKETRRHIPIDEFLFNYSTTPRTFWHQGIAMAFRCIAATVYSG